MKGSIFLFARSLAQVLTLALIATLALSPAQVQASAAHDHTHDHTQEHDHEHEQEHDHENNHDKENTHDHNNEHNHHEEPQTQVQLPADLAAQSGVTTAVAAAGTIHRTLLLYGRLVPDPRHVSHVRARFPGLITRSYRALGDRVKAGDPLLEIEANESLRRYPVVAPISGLVVESHANPGELASDEPLLTIANHDKVWLELAVFARDAQQIRAGQAVTIHLEGNSTSSHIAYLNPGSGAVPYLLARVPVSNADGSWMPGMLAAADVTLEQIQVPLRVHSSALQQVRDATVVFVQSGTRYEARPVQTGRSDRHFTEVQSGLNPGERYVVENSFLLKADLEKSGAAHDH